MDRIIPAVNRGYVFYLEVTVPSLLTVTELSSCPYALLYSAIVSPVSPLSGTAGAVCSGGAFTAAIIIRAITAIHMSMAAMPAFPILTFR